MGIVEDLEPIDIDNVAEHIYSLYVERAPESNQDLGYVNRTKDNITIELSSGIELNIHQSLSQLSSKKETSSTGFVCWRTSPRLADWILTDKRCPFYKEFKSSALDVVELGTGVGAVCASVLAPSTRRYICTDQKHILKLLGTNIIDNISSSFHSETLGLTNKTKNPIIEVMELDWENIEDGVARYESMTAPSHKPDLVIACDTIYNLYLVPHFIAAMKALMGPQTVAVVAVQLRDESTLEAFVEECLSSRLAVYNVPDMLLSEELIYGFVVYYVKLQPLI